LDGFTDETTTVEVEEVDPDSTIWLKAAEVLPARILFPE
jgi:hypothetical protein